MKKLIFLVLPLLFLAGCFSSTVLDQPKSDSQSDGDDFFNLANDLINRNQVGPALISLDEAYNSYSLLDDVSGKTKVLLKKANIFAATGEVAKGDSILSAEFLLLPGRADTINYLNSLTEFYYVSERYDSVLAIAKKFNTYYTSHPTALIATAYLTLAKFALKTNYEMELSDLNRAFVALDRDQRYPADQLAFAFYTRAYIALAEGNTKDAEFWGRKAYDEDLDNEDYLAIAYDLELLAEIAEGKNDLNAAAGFYKRASDSYFALGIGEESIHCEAKSLILRIKTKGDNSFLKNRLKHLKEKITDPLLRKEIEATVN